MMQGPAVLPVKNARACVCFAHGRDSGPWGTKIRRLADHARAAGWPVESLDFRGMALEARVTRLRDWCDRQHETPVLVGSSMGAHVALRLADAARGLFLMAPAVHMPGYTAATPPPPRVPTVIVHGWRDEVVPPDGVWRYAREARCTLHMLDADHRLVEALETLEELFGLFLRGLQV